MNNTKEIIDGQRLTVKRGRTNGLGFEPAFNSFYDFYLDSRYGPLLQLEDVTFFLYLRKNLNDSNPHWKMPSIKYIKKKFGIGYGRYSKMIDRLEKAKLLIKVSGYREGVANVNNSYILHDPLTDYEDFQLVFSLHEGASEIDLHIPEPDLTPKSEMDLPPTSTLDRQEQTSYLNNLWQTVLSSLPNSDMLLGTELQSLENGIAVISAGKSKEWLEQQMSKTLLRLLNIELTILGNDKVTKIEFT
jgi:hypothetical protein